MCKSGTAWCPFKGVEYNELDRIRDRPFMMNAVPKIHSQINPEINLDRLPNMDVI